MRAVLCARARSWGGKTLDAIGISSWYTALSDHTFPTVFVRLSAGELAALLAGDRDADDARHTFVRLDAAIHALPGACVVGTDVCAPTDTVPGGRARPLHSGRAAWERLAASAKVREALRGGVTDRLVVRPYRRMDRTREFRLFIRDAQLLAMSQYCLERHFRRLARRVPQLWEQGREFAREIIPLLPAATLAVDVYLTSEGRFLIVDLNPWGPPTDPLLLRTWDRDWREPLGLRIIPEPVKMKGDVSVSF